MERAIVVAGLALGDEGKGSVVDWLVREHRAAAVVRYNGGPQAAHRVVDGSRAHVCAQIGAGIFIPGVQTFLSRFMLVDPLALEAEEMALRRVSVEDAWARLTIDPRCLVVTPFHRLVNQIQEVSRGRARHGSCGRGVAQAQLDAERGSAPSIRVHDLFDGPKLRRTLDHLWRVKIDLAEQLAENQPDARSLLDDLRRRDRVDALVQAYRRFVREHSIAFTEQPTFDGTVIFEGAQGVLLDRDHGFWPHVTPSRTTFANALELTENASIDRVGVLRAYSTRHGAGPFPTEAPALDLPDEKNVDDPWQGSFRVGWFDAVAARYALHVIGGVDALVVTNVDRLTGPCRIATQFRIDDRLERDLVPSEPTFDARTAWTERIRRATPVYDDLPHVEALLSAIEREVQPIDAVSRAPDASGKRFTSQRLAPVR